MPLLPTSQRDQAKVFIGFVALALAGYYYMYPYAERAADQTARLERVESLEAANAKARLQSRRGRAQELAAEAARYGASLEAMRRLVPTANEVPALLEEVSTAARRAGLDIGGVSPEPVIAGADFDTYRYRVTIAGGYHAVTTFLANVGSLPRIVAPVTFQLAPANLSAGAGRPASAGRDAGAATLAATVTVQTYVAHTPAPAPAGDAARATSAGEALHAEAAPRRAAPEPKPEVQP